MQRLPSWLEPDPRNPGGQDPIGYLAWHSRSFRFATRFLPPREARHIAEVYAFCRFTDDLVDRASGLSPGELESRLDEWEGLVRLAHSGVATGSPILDGPIGRMGETGVPVSYALQLIEGMRMDVRPGYFGTMAELEVYTHRVAGVVGQWLTEMSGVRSPWALTRAAELGHAMQLTNILRDVGEDWARGRLYLPLDIMARHGLTPRDLDYAAGWNGSPPQAYCELMEEMMETAEKLYWSALRGIPALPRYFQRPVLVAALVYQRIQNALRRNGYDNFGKRAFCTAADKFRVGLKALWVLPGIRDLLPRDMPVPAQRTHAMAGSAIRSPAGPIVLSLALLAAAGRGPMASGVGTDPAPRLRSQAAGLEGKREGGAETKPEGGAEAGQESKPAPPERPDVFRQGLAELRASEERIRLHPDSAAPRLDRLRVLYVVGVKEKSYLDAADAEIDTLAERFGGDPGRDNLLMAYRGAVRVARAKHGFNPNRKLTHLKAGIPLLDSAVAIAPDQPEVRYLRLVSGYYLPFFIGRKAQVEADFAALGRVLPATAPEYPPKWFLSVARFVLAKGRLDQASQGALRERADQIAQASGLAMEPVD